MERAGTWRSFPVPVPAVRGEIEVRVWSPGRATDRVLVAHDGPDYERNTDLPAYARALSGHLVLLPAGDRAEWYSASPAYAKGLAREVLPKIAGELGTDAPVVGIGASLGALAMLHAQRRHPSAFAGLFLQSGSFFQPRFDAQESGFARYLRIVRFVGKVVRAGDGPAVPVTITCGAGEENLANNRAMAAALAAQGYPVRFAEQPGGHDWDTWRAALDPHLTSLLERVWP